MVDLKEHLLVQTARLLPEHAKIISAEFSEVFNEVKIVYYFPGINMDSSNFTKELNWFEFLKQLTHLDARYDENSWGDNSWD